MTWRGGGGFWDVQRLFFINSPFLILYVDTVDMVEGVCNGFLPYTRFLGFPEFSGYHQWQQESQ